jgi:Tfp pilus assembly protein FimV
VISPARAANDVDGLPYPDRSVTVTPTASRSGHVVQAGESLWSIAADALPPDATAAQVASASASWYDANRAEIGPDPNLILPGQQLAAPNAEATR